MKTLIIGTRNDFGAGPLKAANDAVSRRKFLVGMGLMAGAMIARPVHALPHLAYDGSSWKDSVCRLVDNVCPKPAAKRINDSIYRADTYYVAPPADFHGSFSSRELIKAQTYPEATYGERFFELAHLPYYDSQNPCRRTKDLNALEIERILNGGEREYYGGVLSPCSERRQLASCGCEWDVYNNTVAYYGEDPDAWEPLYTRNFTDGKSSYLGFAVTPRTDAQGRPLKQLLLSPDSV